MLFQRTETININFTEPLIFLRISSGAHFPLHTLNEGSQSLPVIKICLTNIWIRLNASNWIKVHTITSQETINLWKNNAESKPKWKWNIRMWCKLNESVSMNNYFLPRNLLALIAENRHTHSSIDGRCRWIGVPLSVTKSPISMINYFKSLWIRLIQWPSLTKVIKNIHWIDCVAFPATFAQRHFNSIRPLWFILYGNLSIYAFDG